MLALLISCDIVLLLFKYSNFVKTGSFIMSEVIDYSQEKDFTHYNGVPSMYGKLVDQQYKQQPKYCWPGDATGEPTSAKSNEQAGP